MTNPTLIAQRRIQICRSQIVYALFVLRWARFSQGKPLSRRGADIVRNAIRRGYAVSNASHTEGTEANATAILQSLLAEKSRHWRALRQCQLKDYLDKLGDDEVIKMSIQRTGYSPMAFVGNRRGGDNARA